MNQANVQCFDMTVRASRRIEHVRSQFVDTILANGSQYAKWRYAHQTTVAVRSIGIEQGSGFVWCCGRFRELLENSRACWTVQYKFFGYFHFFKTLHVIPITTSRRCDVCFHVRCNDGLFGRFAIAVDDCFRKCQHRFTIVGKVAERSVFRVLEIANIAEYVDDIVHRTKLQIRAKRVTANATEQRCDASIFDLCVASPANRCRRR